MALEHDRYCDELPAQTDRLRALLLDADPDAPVPTCPDWDVEALLRHVGTNLLTLGAAVRSGDAPTDAEPPEDVIDAWLAGAVEGCARALREADPDAPVRVFGLTQPTSVWARRATHDVLIHLADAAAAVGEPESWTADPDLAADAVDELLELAPIIGLTARLAEPRGPESVTGGTIHLHATDVPGGDAEWLIEVGHPGFTWRRGHEKADVALRGPLSDVLLTLYRRLPADNDRVEVLGDTALLDFWLERISLG